MDAFAQGRKYERENVKPRDGGVPASGRRAPGKAGGQDDPDADIKAKMVAAGELPGIETLFSDK